MIVHTAVRGEKYHESKECGPGPAKRVDCSLREAVKATREPCGNCVSDETREAHQEILDNQ